jgi:hypothetical protein
MKASLGVFATLLVIGLSNTPADADWFEVRRTTAIREAPSAGASQLGVARAGDQFEIVDPNQRTRGYYPVDLGDGRIGYVHGGRGRRHVEGVSNALERLASAKPRR